MVDDRSKRVLWAVVQSYIDTPDPVGSRFITKKFDFGLSPATIRNIMADLEEMGYLMQPHTSAGRVPTDTGYRFYVETLMHEMNTENLDLSDEVIQQLRNAGNDVESLLRETTRIISRFSHYLALASSPRTENSIFRKMEFICYKDNRIAVVLFTNEGTIRHHLIDNDLGLKQDDLNRFAQYINERFSGMTVKELREQLIEEMKQQRDTFDVLMKKTIGIFEHAWGTSDENVFITGFREVVNLPDFSTVEKIKELSQAIEDKHHMIQLIDRFIEKGGIHVTIGDENPLGHMKYLSMVTSTYKESDRSAGIIGIIGPKRMNYQNAIIIVDTAARYISRMLFEK